MVCLTKLTLYTGRVNSVNLISIPDFVALTVRTMAILFLYNKKLIEDIVKVQNKTETNTNIVLKVFYYSFLILFVK